MPLRFAEVDVLPRLYCSSWFGQHVSRHEAVVLKMQRVLTPPAGDTELAKERLACAMGGIVAQRVRLMTRALA